MVVFFVILKYKHRKTDTSDFRIGQQCFRAEIPAFFFWSRSEGMTRKYEPCLFYVLSRQCQSVIEFSRRRHLPTQFITTERKRNTETKSLQSSIAHPLFFKVFGTQDKTAYIERKEDVQGICRLWLVWCAYGLYCFQLQDMTCLCLRYLSDFQECQTFTK